MKTSIWTIYETLMVTKIPCLLVKYYIIWTTTVSKPLLLQLLLQLLMCYQFPLCKCPFFTPFLTGGFSLKTEWQQVSSLLHDFFLNCLVDFSCAIKWMVLNPLDITVFACCFTIEIKEQRVFITFSAPQNLFE